MMSTPSWISRVLYESLTVHLEDSYEPAHAAVPFPSAAATSRTIQRSQTNKHFSPSDVGTRESPEAPVPPAPSPAAVTAAPSRTASVTSPHNATLTSVAAGTTGGAATSPAATPPTDGATAPPDVGASVPATPPSLPPLVDNFVGTWTTLSPGSGLSPETDTSTTSSSKQQEAAAQALPPPTRPTAAFASAPTSPLLSDVNPASKWQAWSSNPLSLSPTAVRRERGESDKNKEKHFLPQRISVAQKAPLERLTTATSTPSLTTMPAAPLAIPPVPSTTAASPDQTKRHEGGPTIAVSTKSVLATGPASPSIASPPVTLALTGLPESPSGSAGEPTRASGGGPPATASTAGPASTVRAVSTAVQKKTETKVVDDDDMLPSSSQVPPRICPPTPTCGFPETPHSEGIREGTGTCGAQKLSLQNIDNLACLRSGGSSTNNAFQESILHNGAPKTIDSKKSNLVDAAFSRGSLGQLAAFCTGDVGVPAATTDALKATYVDAILTPLQPVASSADSTSAFSPRSFCPYPCFNASSASTYYAAGNLETSYGAVSQRIFPPRCNSNNDSSTNTKNTNSCTSSPPPTNSTSSNSISSSNSRSGTNSSATFVECSNGCCSTNVNDSNTSNNSSECSNTSFLPSLLPLLSHMKALSISVSESHRDFPSLAANTVITPPLSQTSSSSSRGGEGLINTGSFDSSAHTGTQTQRGNIGVSPKRTSPYFPFFSFNSISSAFQSPSISHLSRKSFCTAKTIPLSHTDASLSSADHQSAVTVNGLGLAAAALSLDSQGGSALQKTRPAAGNLSATASRGERREGPATARTTVSANENTEGTATAPGYAGVTSVQGGKRALVTQATSITRAPAPTAATRMVPAERKAEGTTFCKVLKPSAAADSGAAVAVAGAVVAAASSPLSFSSAANTADRSAQLTGPYATDQQQLVLDHSSSNSFSSNSGALNSNDSSNITCGPSGTSRSNSSFGFYVSLQTRKSTEHHDFAPAPSTMQHVDWCSFFASDTPHQHAETATAISTGEYTYAVDDVYCLQTPSRTRFSSVRVSPSLSQVYAASDNGVLCVWNMTGCCQRPLIINSYHSKAITELDVSPDGQLLASASLDGTIRLKYTASATHVVHPSCTSSSDNQLQFRPSSVISSRAALPTAYTYSPTVPAGSSHLAAGYNVNAAASHLFDAYQLPAAPPSPPVLPAAQTRAGLHGKKLAATVSHSSVAPSPPCCYTHPSSVDFSQACSVPSSSRLLLPVSAARQKDLPSPPPMHLRRSTPGEQQQQQHTVRGHSNAVVSLHFSSDGALLLSASRDKAVKLWKNPSLDFLAAFTGHTNWVCCARFAPISAAAPVTFASCAEDRTVRVWNAERKVPVLLFRLCESFQSTSAATLCGSLGSSNLCNSTSTHRTWGSLAATGASTSGSKFGPCLKSCRFIFGGASVLAGGSSDGTVTLWDVRQEPKAPSQFYNASWLQSAPLYSTASRPGSAGGTSSSFGGGFSPASSSLICDIDRKGAVKKAGISYLDTTPEGSSLLALSTSGVAHLIDLRYNKPLFSVSHTKTTMVSHAAPLVARGKKAKPTHSHKQNNIHWSTPLQGASHERTISQHVAAVTAQSAAAATPPRIAVGHAAATPSAEASAFAHGAADADSATLSRQQQQRQKRTTAVITAASFGPVLEKYESLSQLQQQQVLATADAEGRVVIWRWDMASPLVLYQQEPKAIAAAAAAEFCMHEHAADQYSAVCSTYSEDNFDSYLSQKMAKDSVQPCLFAEEETRATEPDYVGGTSCRHTAENYSLLDLAGEGM